MGERPNALRAVVASAALVVVAATLSACLPPPPLGPVQRPWLVHAPTVNHMADPAVLRLGGTYFLYGSNAGHRAPVVVSPSPHGNGGVRYEAMPQPVPWAANPNQLWAPTVGIFSGRYVMFFAADRPNPPDPANPQCIGRAWADSPTGPFTAEAMPVHCGVDGRGILDPQIFDGPDGQRWLLVAMGNTEVPIQVIKLDEGARLVTQPFGIYAKTHAWEGRFLENPSMVHDAASNTYVLAYSAGDWWTAAYSVGVARCASPIGFCASSGDGPWLSSASGRTGPGGLSFFSATDGSPWVVYSSFPAGGEGPGMPRAASMSPVRISGTLAFG